MWIDSAIGTSVVGFLFNAYGWFMARQQLKAIARAEDPSALNPLRALEQKQSRTFGVGVVGNLALVVAFLAIAWWRGR